MSHSKYLISKFVLSLLFILAFVLGPVTLASAHEYWIEPLDFFPTLGVDVRANLKVGSDLKGDRLPFIPPFVRSFQAFDAAGTRDLGGEAGDRPALLVPTRQSGLLTITYQTSRSRITFQDWEKFATYLRTQGMPEIIEQHRARELPETDFTELFSRYAKTLVAVDGQTTGSDRATDMRVELVALDNPYALQSGDMMWVQLLWEGAPLADRQVKLFLQSQDEAAEAEELQITILRTDINGEISFPLQADQLYLLSAIQMQAVDPVRGKETWESFWASLTFSTIQPSE